MFVFALFNLQGTAAFRSRGQLLHTSTSFPICQELFSSFFKFLSDVFSFVRPRGQLPYISTSSPICQALFTKYFELFYSLLLVEKETAHHEEFPRGVRRLITF